MSFRFEELAEKLGGEARIVYSLDRFENALREIGQPQAAIPTVLVAGTNGKGTTTLFLSSILKASGKRVCTYLSPHLQSPTERLLLNMEPSQSSQLDFLAEKLFPTATQHGLSYFEFLTLMFFEWSREIKPDFNIVEVGLGGRLDATNAADPIASVLTTISFDHQAYLGNTLESILREKMGILRPRRPVFTGLEQGPLFEILRDKTEEWGCRLYPADKVELLERSWSGQTFLWEGKEFFIKNPSPAMAHNAGLALTTAKNLFPEIPYSALAEGLRRARNPGRFEIVSDKPRVILSGDHNPAGMNSLTELLTLLKAKDLLVVAGFSPDKPAKEMLELIRPFAKEMILTEVESRRQDYPAEYSRLAPFEANAKKAVASFLKKASPSDTVLITGSLYLVGTLRSLWHPKVAFEAGP